MTTMKALKAERARAAARNKSVERALKILKEGTANLVISRSYRAKLRKDVEAAKFTVAKAKSIVKDLREVHQAPEFTEAPFAPGNVDLSASAVAHVTAIRKQPEHHRAKAWCHFELLVLEKAVLQGEIDQATFDAKCAALAAKNIPEWMLKTKPTATEMHPRPSVRLPMARRPVSDPRYDLRNEIPEFLRRST